MALLSELVDKVAERLSMAAGTGVQVYAEDRIAAMIQHKFNVAFDDYWWPQFLSWNTWTLDESTGVVTTDLTEIVKRFDDIMYIYPENSNNPLSELPATINPFTLSGETPIHFDANSSADKVFTVWPKTATGNLNVRVRTKPDDFVGDDDIDFDDDYLILGATWDYLVDDGTNPGASDKMASLFESRRQQLIENRAHAPISLDPATARPSAFTFVEL